MTIAHLRALQATIASAIDEIEGVYAAHGTDFPGLDAPYYPNAGADQDKAEALRIDPTVFAAANRVVAACGQITATVHKPWFTLIDTVDAVSTRALSMHFGVRALTGTGVMHAAVRARRVPRVHRGHPRGRHPPRGGPRWARRHRYRAHNRRDPPRPCWRCERRHPRSREGRCVSPPLLLFASARAGG